MKKFFMLLIAVLTLSCSLTSCLADRYQLIAEGEDVAVTYLGDTKNGSLYFVAEAYVEENTSGTLLLVSDGVPTYGTYIEKYEGVCTDHDILVLKIAKLEYAIYFTNDGTIGFDPMPQH